LIAAESGRLLSRDIAIYQIVISVVTLAELNAGILAASTSAVRADRLATLERLSDVEVIPIDESAALSWARLRSHLAESGGRVNVNDLWIAATAVARGLPVLTQDADFDPLDGVGGLTVVRV
jgi:hypothetical protein